MSQADHPYICVAAGLQLVIAPERVIDMIASCDDATIDAAFARSSRTCVGPAPRVISTTDNLKESFLGGNAIQSARPRLRLPSHMAKANKKSSYWHPTQAESYKSTLRLIQTQGAGWEPFPRTKAQRGHGLR
ncbi:hypothetical protein GCM10010201_08630 [Pilimelia columellifera subsp. columellifera]|uniref:Uncharacterized protein n=1 Tax=Pilimelia columellifera subsp. columellifera TaxID=706583 RepID=A0ABN3N5T7_9ACTN